MKILSRAIFCDVYYSWSALIWIPCALTYWLLLLAFCCMFFWHWVLLRCTFFCLLLDERVLIFIFNEQYLLQIPVHGLLSDVSTNIPELYSFLSLENIHGYWRLCMVFYCFCHRYVSLLWMYIVPFLVSSKFVSIRFEYLKNRFLLPDWAHTWQKTSGWHDSCR